MSGFFSELQRRKVYRVAVAYAVVAWAIIQFGDIVFPAWDLPTWSLRLLITLVLAGFPVALILAWAFDVTPEGIKPAEEGGEAAPLTRVRRRGNLVLLGGFGVVAAAAAAFFLLPRAAADKVDKSIAVLPFENLSDDKDNAYFADGIQDDVLTNLSKIGELKVISRTSVMPYRGKNASMREIGEALGVGAVLEGSVRRSGNRVRVNVQLINARTDEHIWSEIYDRDLTDVFAIQSELAREIASALRTKLSPGEKARLEQKPTENGEAYLVYLQAHSLFNRPDRKLDDLKNAQQLYERALQLDPQFALAHAALSRLQSWLYHGMDPSPERLDKARAAAAEALRLQPDLPEAHLAAGYCYYYGDRDYERALAAFAIARKGLPNDADVRMAVAAIARRKGQWQESTAQFVEATQLNPRDAIIWQNLAINYSSMRDYKSAADAYERGIEAAPDSMNLRILRARLDLEFKGDPAPLEQLVASAPPEFQQRHEVVLGRASVEYMKRNYAEAIRILEAAPAAIVQTDEGELPRSLLLADIYRAAGDSVRAREQYEQARVALEAMVRQKPQNPGVHTKLGKALAGLGRADEAIRQGRRAMELVPESVDALDGPMYTLGMAHIYVTLQRPDEALPLVARLLETPAGIIADSLRYDPTWDFLRADPRFQALLAKHDVAS